MAKLPAFAKAFAGRWRIVEMDVWDKDFLDLVETAHLTFKGAADGEIAFGALKGFLDVRYGTRDGSASAEFSWEGYNACFYYTNLPAIGVSNSASDQRYKRNSSLLEFVDFNGSFRNTTVNSQITGFDLDLGVIDDPIKGRGNGSKYGGGGMGAGGCHGRPLSPRNDLPPQKNFHGEAKPDWCNSRPGLAVDQPATLPVLRPRGTVPRIAFAGRW